MIIWTTQPTETGLFEVGHRDAGGEWITESEHPDVFTARAHARWLTKRDAELGRALWAELSRSGTPAAGSARNTISSVDAAARL